MNYKIFTLLVFNNLKHILKQSKQKYTNYSFIFNHFCSSISGRSSQAVRFLLESQGYNILPKTKEIPLFIRFMSCFFAGFSPILWVAFILAIIAYQPLGIPPTNIYNLALALAILIVIIISSVIEFYQEIISLQILASFDILIPSNCTVIRDNIIQVIDPTQLVLGDLVILNTGERIPADIRIIESNELKVDKSTLTGESEPLLLTSNAHSIISITSQSATNSNENEELNSLLMSNNIAFMGTNVINGTGRGFVIAIGNNNQLSKIVKQVNQNKFLKTSLQNELNRFILLICFITLIIVIIVIIYWFSYLNVQHQGYLSKSQLIANILGIMVALVPEGLPIALQTGFYLSLHFTLFRIFSCRQSENNI